MKPKKDTKGELLIAGIGGWGIVTMGDILAKAALKEYEHVAWFPSYATMMRGGESECCVTFSHERISSPIIYQSSCVMVLGVSRIPAFEGRVRPGGLMLVETTGVTEENKVKRDDVNVRYVAAMEKAANLGSIKNANLVMLGAYAGAANLISKDAILEEIEARFGGQEKNSTTVSACREAFLAGSELVQ
ncbi:MAG: 2-oxoacid:acceptor oxidoreductase family protein [Pseudomonadota bacterium]